MNPAQNKKDFSSRLISSLEKVMINDTPEAFKPHTVLSALKGEVVDFQLVMLDKSENASYPRLVSVTALGAPFEFSVREAVNVYADMPAYSFDTSKGTPYFLESKTGMYPDPLLPIDGGKYVRLLPNIPLSLWFTGKADKSGEFAVKIIISEGENIISEEILNLTVIDARLPKQEIIFTEWFHCDCLASYYNVPVFSERHFEIISSYMKCASENGINCILTPIFTPPLDTEKGSYRPTVQLVGVKITESGYEFDFSLLERWIELAKKNGIENFEMSHLFSQWGAEFAPQVVAEKDGETVRIFGWDTPGTGKEYADFLSAFLPELVAFLKSKNVIDSCVFHISDEPHENQLEGYMRAKSIVEPYLSGLMVVDALSSPEFFRSGAVQIPIPALNHVEPFLKEDISERWTYYCCGQWDKVSNRFIAYPSSRNRILGIQLYKFGITGFLQWGFNFWYSMGSRRLINPFVNQSGDRWVPSGDAFSVYPAPDGTPYESLRLCVFREALQDVSALKLCEKIVGRDEVIRIIDHLAGKELTFTSYPDSPEYIIELRETVNRIISEKGSSRPY